MCTGYIEPFEHGGDFLACVLCVEPFEHGANLLACVLGILSHLSTEVIS